jgi:hypothetical protein
MLDSITNVTMVGDRLFIERHLKQEKAQFIVYRSDM